MTLVGVVGFLVGATPGWSAAAERPVDRGVESPITTPQTVIPTGSGGSVDVAKRPIDVKRYRAQKARASSAPAPRADRAPQTRATSTSFAGLNRNTAASGGFIFTPPDTIVGRSPSTSLEGTNSALRLFNNSNAVLSTMTLNSFFSAPATNGTLFDPKVYYDRNAANPRYVVAALQKRGDNDTDPANNVSRIHLAISRSSNPTSLAATQWCRYSIEGRRNIGTANESWADYPGLGAGANALVLSVNQFNFAPPRPFTFAVVHVIRKVAAYNNTTACPSITRFTFQPSSTLNDGTTFTLQPAQSYTSPSSFTGSASPAYLVSNSTSDAYSVYRVRNVATASPTISSTSTRASVANSFQVNSPPDAVQRGTSILLDTGDRRVLQVSARGNTLNHVSSAACQFTGGATESCFAYTRTTVGQNAAGNVSATRVEQRLTGFGDNTFTWMPGVATNSANQSTTPVQFSSSTVFLSGRALFKNLNAAFSQAFTTSAGTCSQTDNTRTGDYTGAQADPSTTDMWVATEAATTVSGLSGCNWSTRIAKITP